MKAQVTKKEEPKKTPKEELMEVVKKMVESTYIDQTEDVALYFLNWLKKEKGFMTSGLSLDQDDELSKLRLQMVRYKDLDENNKANQPPKEEDYISDEDPNDIDEELDKEDVIKKRMATEPRKAISTEVYTEEDKPEEYTPKIVEKPPELIETIRNRLIRLFHFDVFDYDYLLKVIELMYEKKVYKDGNLIRQGELSETLYLVTQGSFDCFKTFEKGKDPLLIKILYPGDVFGELGLLYKNEFPSTIKALEDSVCWCLDRAAYNYLKAQYFKIQKDKVEALLKNVEMFKDLKPEELSLLAEKVKTGVYTKDDVIFKEGQYGDVLYVVESGDLTVTKSTEPGKPEQEIKTYTGGDYFGEVALVCGEVRGENVIAKSDVVKVIALDKKTIRNVLGPAEIIFKPKYEQEMERRAKIAEEKRLKHEKRIKEQLAILEEEKSQEASEISEKEKDKDKDKEKNNNKENSKEMLEQIEDKIKEEPENDKINKSQEHKEEKHKRQEEDKKSHHSKKEEDKKIHHSKKEEKENNQKNKNEEKNNKGHKKKTEDNASFLSQPLKIKTNNEDKQSVGSFKTFQMTNSRRNNNLHLASKENEEVVFLNK